MEKLNRTVRTFVADERGATAIEYAIIASGIAGAIVVAVGTLGTAVTNMWTAVKDSFG